MGSKYAKEKRIADILDKFTDEIGSRPKKGFIDGFLKDYPELEEELRPLLELALILRSNWVPPRMDQKTSDEIFARITKELEKEPKKKVRSKKS